MRIICPLCGERGAEEFVYHGDATVRRPHPDSSAETWNAYVHLRDNPAGRHSELWYHAAGCHAWLVVERDVRTHEIFAVTLAQDVALARRPVTA
ncbi:MULTISPECIES: sarcosine oxidase subunit delta [unclassified Acidisoma]|jgi:heterotetrameric sarcosine oxidase delta subunit|uniref:sarcosine oxidase subunit delta n=1 Tax=unclassified Acidisoma TaxID=2634065 RepID=UPI00131DA792|nr:MULTISPECIES: sarcosine oxidase subunit delta [unclassified Acidisoma]